MCELDNKQKVELAKVLMDSFTEGDWIEIFTITDCEGFLSSHQYFLNDVKWDNDGLKRGCIDAISYILSQDNKNLKDIWNFENVQNNIKRRNLQLFNFLSEKLEGIPNIELILPHSASQTIINAISDANLLLSNHGADKAFDRVHTAFQAYLQQVCDNNNIVYDKLDGIDKLNKNVYNYLENQPNIDTNKKVTKILKTIGSILGSFNDFRNNNSLAHPNENLLSEADATYVINIIQSTVKYLENLLKNN